MADRRAVIGFVAVGVFVGASIAAHHARMGEPVALVELFTSEGCSSCPPADDVLAGLVKGSDDNVYCLAFHVDYWDRLGWPDRFADKRFTDRQRSYASDLKARGLYTPQMVVNGTSEFIGSDRARASREVRQALRLPSTVQPEIHSIGEDGSCSVTIDHTAEGWVLHAAVVERGIVSNVGRGENEGRTLRHENVVRAFESSFARTGEQTVRLEIPPDVDRANASVVVWVQAGETGRVLGAAAADLE